jgi:FeS assembly SUF system protein
MSEASTMSVMDWLKHGDKVDQSGEGDLQARVIEALRTVFDPEIPVNIYDLGLVYALEVDQDQGRVTIRMTLTAPGCPVAQTFPSIVEDAVLSVEGVNDATVELVWDPPWSRERMSEAARLQLGML